MATCLLFSSCAISRSSRCATAARPVLQVEKARIPFANVGLVKLPDTISDDQAILLSDIFPTAYFGAELAEVKPGDTVAVLGSKKNFVAGLRHNFQPRRTQH